MPVGLLQTMPDLLAGFLDGEDDEAPADDEADETDATAAEPTPTLDQLRTTGDPNEVGRTPVLGSDDIPVEPGAWPLGFPLQGVPRVAVTLSLQHVYNEEKDRWERDTGNDGGGAFTVVATGSVSADEADYPQTDSTGLTDPEANYAILPSIGDISEWTGTGELPVSVTGDMQSDDNPFLFSTESSLMAYLHYTGLEWIAVVQVNTGSAVTTVTVDYQVMEVTA